MHVPFLAWDLSILIPVSKKPQQLIKCVNGLNCYLISGIRITVLFCVKKFQMCHRTGKHMWLLPLLEFPENSNHVSLYSENIPLEFFTGAQPLEWLAPKNVLNDTNNLQAFSSET